MRRRLRGFWRDRRGATAVVVGLMMTAIIGLAGFVIDLGHVMYVQRELQSATDASALAGARELNCCATSITLSTATAYSAAWASSSVPGTNRNVDPTMYMQMAPGYPKLMCFTSTGVSCAGPDASNGVVVKQTADVPTWFAGIFGITSIPVSAEATAGGTGGAANDYDIEIVLDTTASMNSNDPNCGMSKIACALAGVEALLRQVSPSADYVGLMAFPGLASTTEQSKDYTCGAGNPTTTAYKNVPTTTTAGNPTYQVVGLSHDYKASSTSTSLTTTSNLVVATGGGGCQGMQAPGGYGTFFADAITAAQNDLTANGRPDAKKAIVFLSDGDANASTANMTAAEHAQQCHEAIAAAQAATAAGTEVMTIGYAAPMSGCSTDTSPSISPCATLQQMASTASDFYSDQGAGCVSSTQSLTSLISIFSKIGASFSAPRLLPNDVT
jgi:Flp pilus assembly protein TadG